MSFRFLLSPHVTESRENWCPCYFLSLAWTVSFVLILSSYFWIQLENGLQWAYADWVFFLFYNIKDLIIPGSVSSNDCGPYFVVHFWGTWENFFAVSKFLWLFFKCNFKSCVCAFFCYSSVTDVVVLKNEWYWIGIQ